MTDGHTALDRLVVIDETQRVVDGIIVLPFAEFVELLWSGELTD